MKLSLAVIAKDEKEQIHRIIYSYQQYFDELVFLVDNPETIKEFDLGDLKDKVRLEQYVRSEEENKVDHIFFDRKRNELTKFITGDYYFRLDTDDAIINPENIRSVAEKAHSQSVNIVYCWYEYAKDVYGNVHAAHYRETIIKNTPELYWNKRIHENIIPTNTSTHRYVMEDSIIIDHLITAEKAISSGERNLKYLIEEYSSDPENCDPRTLAYLGRMLFDTDLNKSQFFLEKHIASSGWDEDRYMSWCLLAEVMNKKGNVKDAIGCCFEAMAERPDFPDAYFKLHSIYVDEENWKQAIHWAKIGFQLPLPKTFMLLDPSAYSWRPMLSLAYCYLQENQPEEAWELFQEVKKKCPGDNNVTKNEYIFQDAIQRKKFTDHFMWLYDFIKGKDSSKLLSLFESIPQEYEDHEGLMSLKNHITPPKKWSDKSIVFYCGKTTNDWADPSVIRGIGGSEEAVIYLSRKFVKMGYEVTVFCQCGSLEGKYNGVNYINSYKINPNDNFNIFYSWRANVFQLADIKAKKKIVWLHDLPQESQFEKGKYNFDKVIVLSEYHKSLLPKHIPEEKIYVSTNGINIEDFKNLDNLQRQKNRVIYASSYDRGLEELLQCWHEVIKEIPDAELHIFYGWNTYKELIKLSKGSRSTDFVERMEKLMDQPGVFEHGRIGHKELLEEYARSYAMAYPCKFAGEINCIALTKAIACGCRVISNDYAVMPERNPDIVTPNKYFSRVLIETLKNNEPLKINTEEYKKQNSWESVAEAWHKDLMS